jgi:hypothetical protein
MRAAVRAAVAATRRADIAFATTAAPTLSVVIPAFNHWRLTRRALAYVALYANSDAVEVILVDD